MKTRMGRVGRDSHRSRVRPRRAWRAGGVWDNGMGGARVESLGPGGSRVTAVARRRSARGCGCGAADCKAGAACALQTRMTRAYRAGSVRGP